MTSSEQTIKKASFIRDDEIYVGHGLKDLKEKLAQKLYNLSPSAAMDLGICIQCKEPALPKCYSAAGRKEYHNSALCEQCFDAIFE